MPGFSYTNGRSNVKSVVMPNGEIEWQVYEPGMTIREMLAGRAMQGLLANPHCTVDGNAMVKDAVCLADLLIAELAKEGKV